MFCYSKVIFYSRMIEAFCKYDLWGLFILGGKKAHDHSTICHRENVIYMRDKDVYVAR